jgi:hypothetical protein
LFATQVIRHATCMPHLRTMDGLLRLSGLADRRKGSPAQ